MGEKTEESVGQFLTFNLQNESFGLNVKKVREILELIKITKVPQMPSYMIGVINLRGKVVPVIDLRNKFDMEKIEETIETCIIVVEIEQEETTIFGIIVDRVQEVVVLNNSEILPAPKIGTKVNNKFIAGIGKQNDEFIILIDIDEVFTHEEIEIVQEVGNIKQKLSEEIEES